MYIRNSTTTVITFSEEPIVYEEFWTFDDPGEEERNPLDIFQWSSKEVGAQGERIARDYLEKKGFEVVLTNWRCSGFEADIVCDDAGTAVLVEVKTRVVRKNSEDIVPEIAVSARKRERYKTLALLYLAHNPQIESVRFDVVAINLVAPQQGAIRHLVGAFGWDE